MDDNTVKVLTLAITTLGAALTGYITYLSRQTSSHAKAATAAADAATIAVRRVENTLDATQRTGEQTHQIVQQTLAQTAPPTDDTPPPQ